MTEKKYTHKEVHELLDAKERSYDDKIVMENGLFALIAFLAFIGSCFMAFHLGKFACKAVTNYQKIDKINQIERDVDYLKNDLLSESNRRWSRDKELQFQIDALTPKKGTK